MLEDLISQRQWRTFVHRLSSIRQLSLRKIRTGFAHKGGSQKPSLIVSIGKRRKVDALEEYRRRFASPADRENQASRVPLHADQGALKPQAQPDRDSDRAKQPQMAKYPGRGGRKRRSKVQNGRGGDLGRFYRAIWGHLVLALLRGYDGVARVKFGRNELIAVSLACAVGVAGAYAYRTAASRHSSLRATQAGRASDASLEKGGAKRPNGKKLTYERLTSGGPEAETAPQLVPSPDNRADGPLPESARSGDAPVSPQPAGAEPSPPAPVPSIIRLDSGQVRPPFLAAAQPPAAPAGVLAQPAQEEPVTAPASPPPAPAAPARPETSGAPGAKAAEQAPAEPAQPSDGYFVQVKSDQDLKAAEGELTAIADKYKAVLGEVPLITRSVDLKEKGVWFRVLAGPVKSRDEASNLCGKLKSAGLPACIVHKSE
jgi:cell division protein FtsN